MYQLEGLMISKLTCIEKSFCLLKLTVQLFSKIMCHITFTFNKKTRWFCKNRLMFNFKITQYLLKGKFIWQTSSYT